MTKLQKTRSFTTYGKLPPQAIDLEEAVLGALMIGGSGLDVVNELLVPECFYKESNQIIYQAILNLSNNRKPADILTVTEELKKMGKLEVCGGAFHITQLTDRVASTAHIEFHARIIAEKYLQREVIRVSSEYASRGFDDQEDVFELIDELWANIDTIRNYGPSSSIKPFSISVDERVKEKEDMVKNGVVFSGISTGSTALDKVISGFVKSNLIILAARPAMGKSVKALNYAKEAALQGIKSGEVTMVFSLEMSTQELVDRFVVEQAKIPLHHYRANDINQYQLESIRSAARELKKLPIIIDDTPSVNCKYIRKKVKSASKNHHVNLIIIDYIQLMVGDVKTNNREQEVASISRGLKAIAKEFEVPVLALAQVGRGMESTKDKRPSLEHLRESGQLEADADVVMFIYRPSYYFQHGDHPDDKYSMENMSAQDYEQVSELLIAKNRNGQPTKMIKERFIGAFSEFVDFNDTSDNPFNNDIIPIEETPTVNFNPAPF